MKDTYNRISNFYLFDEYTWGVVVMRTIKKNNNNKTKEGNNFHRKRTHILLLLISITIIITIIAISSFSTVSLTLTEPLCSTCHEMVPENRTLEASAHHEVACVDCHVGKKPADRLVYKANLVKEAYSHFVGPPDPIVQTTFIPDEACLSCHEDDLAITPSGDLIVAHEQHIDEQIPCITCHSGVAHAKIAERGLINASDLDYWIDGNIDKLVTEEYVSTNMGTCIECHVKVNNGERPWEDELYSLPDKSHYYNNEQNKPDDSSAKINNKFETEELSVQEKVFKSISKQRGEDVAISMSCQTCHDEISFPDYHKQNNWDENHGDLAKEKLDECLDCHSDSKWQKQIPEQNIACLIEREARIARLESFSDKIAFKTGRNNFCYSCHEVKREDGYDLKLKDDK